FSMQALAEDASCSPFGLQQVNVYTLLHKTRKLFCLESCPEKEIDARPAPDSRAGILRNRKMAECVLMFRQFAINEKGQTVRIEAAVDGDAAERRQRYSLAARRP